MSTWEQERNDIRASGLRATASRMAVLALLRECGTPLSHAEVSEKLSEGAWDKVTVYRNLIDLAESGLLRRIAIGNTYRFESPHKHASPSPVHFVCTECETVQCLPGVALPPLESRGLPKSIQNGNIEIHIRGTCDGCE